MSGWRSDGILEELYCEARAVGGWTRHWCAAVRLMCGRCAPPRRPEPLWRAPRCVREELAGRGADRPDRTK